MGLRVFDLEIAGYKLSDFQWYWDLIIIAGVLLLIGGFYLLFVWFFTRSKMTKNDEKAFKAKYKAIKKMPKAEKKATKNALSGTEKRLFVWRKMRIPFAIFTSIFVVVGLIAAPVLPTVWDQLMQTLHPDRGVGGDNSSESTQLAIGAARENVETLEKEGMVLLKNHDNVLPLNVETNNKVNIFGSTAFGMLYGGGGSGVFITNDTYNGNDFHAIRFEDAMVSEGFEYNQDLYNLVANYYESKEYKITPTNYDIQCQNNAFVSNTIANGHQYVANTCFPYDNEPAADAYEDTYAGLNGQTLLDAAKEYSDIAIYAVGRAGSEDGDIPYNTLALTDREEAMIQMLADNFDKVIFLIDSSNVMELEPLELDGVDSVLWIGHPGLTGNAAVAKAISGKINPSGKLVDTWNYHIWENPSFESFGPDTTEDYSNANYNFVEYLEGIYVGYRYFVTRALTDPTFVYEDHVQYSFGEGYSYTTFEKAITDYVVDEEKGEITVEVKVTNTGDVPGKEVIELYHESPYYQGGIEVPSRELCAFAKTNELAKDEEQTIELKFNLRDMALWNSNAECYTLLHGTHEISLRDNVWDITEESDMGDNLFTFDINDDINYTTSYETGYEYQAQFEDAEYGPNDDALVYLSRSDWEGTYPDSSNINRVASSYTIENSRNKSFEDNQIGGPTPTMGARNGVALADLRGKDYDDELWEDLLDELTYNDMCNLIDNGGFQTVAIPNIGKRATYDDDGPASIQIKGTGYPSEVVIASSWNTQCAKLLGESAAREGAAMGLTGWYAPGMNIHRCPTGGRNFEYFSEDPLITGMMGGAESQGTMKYGVYTYAKHFALNEQETCRAGLEVWANEQSIRQIYLRGFEIYVNQGGLGFMSSFSRVGNTWSGGHEGLCREVLRNEWGFNGVVITDYVNANLMPVDMGLRGGNDLWLIKNSSHPANDAAVDCPHDAVILMREACHHILYACAQSNCVWTEDDYEEVGILDINWDLAGYLNF